MAPVSLQFIVWFTIIYWIYPTEGEDRKIVTGISILGHDAQHVVAQKNAKLLLNCSVSSQFGDPYIRWQKNGIPLNLAADNHIQKVQNGSLYFKKFYHKKKKNITDEGVYECLATNKKGTILARRVKLEVAGIARSFSLQPQDQTVVEGGVARFQCQIKASPPPLYFWLKEGVPLNADARHVLISTGILQILNVESGDAGTYQCTATPGKLHDLPDQVEHFKWKRSNTITLTVTPGKQNRPPTIVAGPQNTTVVEGQSAVLECLVDGSPKPTVTWMRRDGSNILRSGGVIFGDTNLKILEVKPMHSDSYYCNASVPGFPPVIARATLDVLTRPVIQRGPRSVTYPAAHSARFFCEVNGKPRPKLQWLKNGRDIRDSSDSSYKIRNYSELIITGTVSTDSGYYQCIAENVVDYTMKIARLEVYAEDNAPKPPTEVSAKANNSTSVLVAWNAAVSDSRPLIAYSLDIHEKENPSEKENFVVQGTTYRLIRGLKPYTNYSLFVRAYNNVGASQRSEVITVRTLEDVPTAAPLIRVRNTTPTSMEIEWKELPTQQRNGKITSYKIFVKKEDDTAIKMEESNNGSITSYIIQGLEPSTTYKVRVLAGTKIGYPRLSDDKWHWIQDTTPPFADPNMSVPTCPTLEVIPINLTSVNVTWVQDSLGIPVTTYTIFLKRLDSPSKERQFADVPPKPNYFVITELSNETHYQVSLIAENQNGASGPVVQEFVTEENPAPPAPRSLEADVDSNSIHLTWVQPTSPVVIEQYVIRYQPWMSQKDSAEEKILTSKKIGVLISDLKPYTYYHIDVRAQSRYSSSRYSHPILERTKEDRPSEPRNLQVAVRTDSGLVIIKWSPPARPNGNITTYIVMVSPDGDHSGWKSIKVNGSLTSAKIEDLHGGTYYVKIMACTKAGPGPSSEQIKVLAISQQPKQPDKKQQNPSTPLEDQKLGIILGVTIGVVCIIICILIIMLRHRCFNHAYPHTQPVHAPGNGHVMGYHANGHMLRLDRELHEMEPYTPMLTQYPENHHLDSKGCGSGNLIVTPNGSRVNGYVPFSNGLRNGHAHNGQVATFMSSASQPEIKMPRRRFWKKSLAKKQAVLQTDVTEDTSLDKNSIVVDLDMTEDTGLGKNSIRDLTNDVTEDTGLGKNSIRDCEDTALLKTVSKSNVEKLEQKFEQKLEHKLEHKLECKLESNLESKLESNLKSKLESKPENYFASKLENNLEKSNLCNLNATSFTNENSLDSADKDVIFENQTGPVIYPFQQLSFGTKLKLIKQLGIEANIKRIFNNDSVGLGKPENTRSILGDGNCFFRALSFAVSDEENHHLLFRKAVVNHMMRFQHKFTTHLRSGFKSVPEYLSSKRMIHGGTWATEVEILAAADLLKVDIYIYDEVSSWELFSAKQVDKCSKIEQNGIYLIHRHQAHYDVVLSVEKAVSINVENFNGNRHTSDEKYSVSSGIDHTEEYDLQDASELIPLINIEHGNKNRNIATQRGNMLCTDVSCGNLSFYEASKAEVTFQNEKEVVQGNFHQGHPTFLNNAGKQCVLNSLSALLYSREKTMNLWTALDLDHTLVKGDEMYGYIRNSSAVNYDYLSISDIPRLIEYNEKMYKIEFQESLSGTLGNVGDLDQYQFVTMYEALQVALDQHQIHGVFITFKGNTFVVVKQTGGYFVFDSHSRNRAGLQVSDGNSLLMYLKDIQQVYDHCINLAASMNYSPQDMFEVTAVHVVYWQVEFNEYDSSNVLSGQKHRNCLKENEECNVEEKEPLINNECQMQTLLDKYFQYQENMNKKKSAHKIQSDKKPDRKQYMRNYMKKRRESCKFKICDRKFSLKSKRKSRESRDFCEHECEAQRGARQNPEMKIKNKQSTLKTMTKARKSKDFCEHECEAKRAARQNPEMKMKNKQSTLKTMTKARKSKDFCEHECEAQRAARQNPEMKMKNKQSTLKTMTKARKSKDFCEHECEAQRAARQNPEMKMKNKQSTLKTMTKARKSKDFCEHECEAKRAARQNPDTKMKNKQSTLKTMTKARKSKDFCEHECEAQRAARQNPQMKIKNKQSTLKTMTKARKSKNFCEHEYEAQRAARKNPEVKNKNRQSTLKTMAKARKSKDFCEHEIEAKRIKRQHPLQLECERILKQESRKRHRMNEKQQDKITKAVKRRKVEFSKHEADLTMKRTYGITIDECIEKFHETAAKGPVFVCTCCHQTWFPRSVVKLSTTNISKQSKAYCTGFKSQEDEEWLCRTCLVSLKEDKIPKLSAHNGMKWPTKPEVLKLHPLEERLISQRIPFMQIRELPRGGQLSAKGNVVNVPVDIQPTVNALPRQIDEHVTIAVKLKKRLSHKSACFTENVRPNAVMKALDWLMKNSEMYQNAGITVNSAWKETILDSQNELTSELTGRSHTVDERETETPDDEFCEISTDEGIQGNSDTLVDEADTDTNKVYVFAPGENQKPLSLYDDKDAEYLCFPTIFCGQRRKPNSERTNPIHYSDIAKWELRSVDRRAANSVPNIFFKLKKIQTKQVSDKVNLALRRCKTEGKKLTAGQARDSSTTNEIVRLNEGYYIFRTLRNSPAYLSSKKKDVFAMIRQLGLPTWFISLSSADTRWTDLLRTLAQLDGKTLSNNDLKNADWSVKTNLVQKDPVTCARYFDNRVQLFINSFLKSPYNPIGAVTDTFRRVEFQNRGSPHIHMLVWTKDAPRYPDDDEKDIIEYVDKYVTCSLQTNNPELAELVELQMHKHSKTCKKRDKPVCRFGFPLPPLPNTMLLEPLETDVEKYKKKYSELQRKMNEYKDGCSLSFSDFLQNIVQMEEDEYIRCIRSSLKGPKIFLKRNPAEMRVNYYNPAVLKAWHANLDIQFVLDPYACATYIVSYISKSQRGISALLEKASQEATDGNMDLRRQVRHIGNKFLNFVEVSAQEASYLILQMPLTQATRDVVFINTSPPDERVFLLKSQEDLENLPENSTDIKAENMISRYAKRPKQLQNWCLADVVSELEVTFPEKCDQSEVQNDDDVIEEENFSDEDVVVHLKNGIKIRKRKNKRVIRYVSYSKKTNSEQYYRERIFLFLPWRNENTDIINGYTTFEQHYRSKANIIQSVQKKYEHFADELEQARLQAEYEVDDFDEVAPNTEHTEAEDADIGPQPSEQFVHFDPGTHGHKNYDIGPDIGLPQNQSEIQTSPVRMPEDQYHKLLQSLNCRQREFHNHVTHWIQNKDEPLYAFLTGGAGTGKSVVIDALYQTLHRTLCSEEGENPDDVRILLCAYTGKAAYNINGMTIASAFHKKMYQTQQNMYADELNTYRTKYRNLSVVIIDEISMVGNKLLAFIHERLQQLTGTKQDFGGISIIAVGDLYQLSPVGDAWIFKDLSCPGQGLAKNLWKEHFTMFELTEIMRQKDDMAFSKLLNRLRHNELSDQDRQTIMTRKIQQNSTNYPQTAPHLFIENKFVDNFNTSFMLNLTTNKVDVKADTDVLSQTKLSPDVKKSLIANLPDKHATTGQLKTNLTIAVNMIYDISVNLDVADGLTNGCTCVVKYIEYKHSALRPAIVWVLFDDEKVGAMRRHQYQHLLRSNIHKSWTPIFETKRTFTYNKKTFERIQFPLQPSAAKTIHKAQGATLNQVVVSLSQTKKRKIPHIHYVALSRVRSLENLHIIDFNEDGLSKDKDVDAEMKRLAENGLKLCYTPLYNVNMHGRFLFNNVRSLNKHISDIRSDPNLYAAELVGIAESRLWESDENYTFQLEGFNLYRNDAESLLTRPHHGLVTYVKSHLHETRGLIEAMMAASTNNQHCDQGLQSDQHTTGDKVSLDDIDRSSENDVSLQSLPQNLECPEMGHTDPTNNHSQPQENTTAGKMPTIHTSTGLGSTKHLGRPPDCNQNTSNPQHTVVSCSAGDHAMPHCTEEPSVSLPHGTSSSTQPSTSSKLYPSSPPTQDVSTSLVGGDQEKGSPGTSGDAPTLSSHQPKNLSKIVTSRGGSGYGQVDSNTHRAMSNQGDEPCSIPKHHKNSGRADKEHYPPQQPPPPPYPGRPQFDSQDKSQLHQKQSMFSPLRQISSNCRDVEV